MKRLPVLRRAIALAVILNLLGMPAAMALSCLCLAPTPEAAQPMSMMMDMADMHDMPAMQGMDMDGPRDGAPVGALHGGCQGECPHGKQAMARPDALRVPAAALLAAWTPPPAHGVSAPVSIRASRPFHLQRITSPPPSRLHCCLRI